MSASLASSQSWSRSLAPPEKWWIAALVLGGGVALLYFGSLLSPATQTILAALLLLLLAVGLRRGWIKLFGPVLLYDLVRTARHSRVFLLRCVYLAALLAVLVLLYSEWFTGSDGGVWTSLLEVHHIPPADMAHFADEFFTRFLAVQLGMVLLLTPAYTGSALTEEKERKTLDYLLTTDLRTREIVLGKLASRFAHLCLFLLAGLPILGLLQLLGGVDPNLVLAAFAGTVLTMLSLASLGILISAYAERPRTAIFVTYLLAGFFLLCSFPIPGLNVGNPFAAWEELMEGAKAGTLAITAPKVLRGYAVVHGLIALLCWVWASVRLRDWNQVGAAFEPDTIVVRVSTAEGTALIWKRIPVCVPERPEIGGNPLLWKENHVEWTLRIGPGGRAFLAFLMIFAGAIAGCLLLVAFTFGANGANVWVGCVGTSIACLLLLVVALRSAAAFSRERDRNTWESLITTPLEPSEIFWAKAWGSILCVRWGWLFLGVVWGLGIVTCGLGLFMLPVLAVAWLAHAGLITGAGMWFSLVSRTTLRATVYTLLAVVLLVIGPLFVGSHCAYRFSAPLNLWMLVCGWNDIMSHVGTGYDSSGLLAAFAGIPFVAGAAAGLWSIVWMRFMRCVRVASEGCKRPGDAQTPRVYTPHWPGN